MSQNPFLGIAKRWLQEQIDPGAHGGRREADSQLGQALLPRLHAAVAAQEAAREEREAAREAARRAALDVVEGCALTVTGDLPGLLPQRVLAGVDVEYGVLVVRLEDDGTTAGTVPFQAFDLAVPGWHGPGTYDLASAYDEDTWDLLWFGLTLDVEDEYFFWDPTTCHGTVVVGPDGTTAIDMALADAASRRVTVQGTIPLPQLVVPQ